MPNNATFTQLSLQAATDSIIYDRVLTPAALQFLEALHLQFNERRLALLERRKERQTDIANGTWPNFLPETEGIRQAEWVVAHLPSDLLDRRVEITGPVERKMIINALNSGAKVFMADFEDSNTPNWENVLYGQLNLQDAIRRTINFTHPTTGKQYKLNDQTATLMVRPRGWHLEEKHIQFREAPLSGALVDFGLYFFHNASTLVASGSGPYFYLPKLESHQEARLWNDVFVFAQNYLGIPQGTIKATVLIETILAAFEMDEILYELRQHSAGLNCGRWDYIFSFIKKFRAFPERILPNRGQITMTVPFMQAYCDLLIKTCHRRGVHAMGGMAAQIPIKNDPAANQAALEKVRQDKLREAKLGHDGSWVAHPGLVPVAMEVFDEYLTGPNQVYVKREEVNITAEELLAVPNGTITEDGVRENIRVGILYVESWLRGRGAAALFHKMEDAATAEISRTQLWQWLQQGATLGDGQTLTVPIYDQLQQDEITAMKQWLPAENRLAEAIELFDKLVKQAEYADFLTLPAYELI
ncbi:MAG: malate synthase A [Bacteroidota bacterium]